MTSPDHPDHPGGWHIAWGTQLDIQPLTPTATTATTTTMAASYLAKYATKATEITGHISTRLTRDTIDHYADPDGDHTARLIDACWRLGRPQTNPTTPNNHNINHRTSNPYAKLRRWAHMLGYGGHFLTKARRYSTTFAALRNTRTEYRRSELAHEHNTALGGLPPVPPIIICSLTYVDAGWRTHGDALLANTAAALARERARIGREELAHLTVTTGKAHGLD